MKLDCVYRYCLQPLAPPSTRGPGSHVAEQQLSGCLAFPGMAITTGQEIQMQCTKGLPHPAPAQAETSAQPQTQTSGQIHPISIDVGRPPDQIASCCLFECAMRTASVSDVNNAPSKIFACQKMKHSMSHVAA